MPKTKLNETKLAAVLNFFHQSRTAHTLKDLEKSLPAAVSISGMQVKDYLTALVDERQIHVEKIGAGNWYWSFPGEAVKEAEAELARAQANVDKVKAQIEEVKAQIQELKDAGADEEDVDRDALIRERDALSKEIEDLDAKIAEDAENAPEALERMKMDIEKHKEAAEEWTDQILTMEMWLSERCIGAEEKEQFLELKREIYGKHFDEETETLKDL